MRVLFAVFALGLGAFAAAPAAAAEAKAVDPAVLSMEHFIRRAAPLCLQRPAMDCVQAGWAFADRDGDDRVSLAELQALRGTLIDWTDWRGESLRPGERTAITLGVWVADNIGLEELLASYNTSGDGLLTREELLADVTLDRRPLGQVLLDPEGLDREAMAQRLGHLSPMLKGFLITGE